MQSALRTRSICIIAELIFLSANVEAEDLRTLLKLKDTCPWPQMVRMETDCNFRKNDRFSQVLPYFCQKSLQIDSYRLLLRPEFLPQDIKIRDIKYKIKRKVRVVCTRSMVKANMLFPNNMKKSA